MSTIKKNSAGSPPAIKNENISPPRKEFPADLTKLAKRSEKKTGTPRPKTQKWLRKFPQVFQIFFLGASQVSAPPACGGRFFSRLFGG